MQTVGLLLSALSALVSVGIAVDPVIKFNVLFIMVDDLKPTLGAYGDVGAQTPNIDNLLNRGLRFENANTQKSECAPSRISVLTGHRNDELKMWGFSENFRNLHKTMVTFPGFLRANGYRTESVGKNYDNRYFGDQNPNDLCQSDKDVYCSFDDVVLPNMIYDQNICNGVNALRWPTTDPSISQANSNKFQSIIWEFEDDLVKRHIDYCVSYIAQEKLRRLAASGTPFYLGVGFMKPHLPWVAPKTNFERFRTTPDSMFAPPPEYNTGSEDITSDPFWDSSNTLSRARANDEINNYPGYLDMDFAERSRSYHAAVSATDDAVGQLMKTFDEEIDESSRNNTIVIFWGDHGYHLGDHNIWCKKSLHEQATRVPLGIVPPRNYVRSNPELDPNLGSGLYTLAPVDSVDIFPTVLDLTNLDFPVKLAGTSLVPLMEDPNSFVRTASVSQYESYPKGYMGYSIRTQYHRMLVFLENNNGAISSITPRAIELYRYSTPGNFEAKNLADDPAFDTIAEEMLALLKDTRNSKNIPDTDWTHLVDQHVAPFDLKWDSF